MIFATEETVKQPKGGLILEPQTEQDYVLGSNDPKSLGQIVLPDGHWAKFAPRQEIQRVSDGDTYGCVSFADNNIDEFIHKAKYGTEIDISDMFVVVASNTERGLGNSMKAPAETKRKKGFVFESEYPYSRSMTLDQFYAPITPELYKKAEGHLNEYDTGYLFSGGAGHKALLAALQVSPIKVAIEGRYVFDGSGRLKATGADYNHAVVLFDYVGDIETGITEWWLFDSETEQFLKARADYAFVSPMVKFLEKKTPMQKLYKKKGEPAIAVKHWAEDSLIAFASGVLPGGDLFKSLYGITDYKAMPREDVEEWPFPIKYLITTTEFEGAAIINE